MPSGLTYWDTDYLHAQLSNKADADELLTRDTLNFQRLVKAKVVWP